MAYKIQHLKLGGVLDQAITLSRNHFGLLFGIMLCLMVPTQLVMGLVQLSQLPVIPPGATQEEILLLQMQGTQSLGLQMIFLILFGLIIGPVTNAAVIHAISRLYLGQPASVLNSLKNGWTALGALIWTSILYFLSVMGGVILLVIPGILFAIWFGLFQHVVVIEGINGFAALKRSKQLVQPYSGTFIGLGIVLTIVNIAFQVGAAFIPQVHAQLVMNVLGAAVLTILATAAGVVFYFSCRCGIENFDLQYLAESIEAEPAQPGDTQPAAT